MKSPQEKGVIIAIIAFVSIGLDQYSKYLAVEHLMNKLGGISYFDGFFRLIFAENTGAFLSLGSETSGWVKYTVLYAFPVVLLIGLVWYILKTPTLQRMQVIALSLVLGGGISNIFDRLANGKVVDFMVMGWEQLKTGVFNIADVSIMAGLFLLIFSQSTQGKVEEVEEKEEEKITE